MTQSKRTSLHFVEAGRGSPLLLVHGFPLDHSMWTGQIEPLSRQCRVIAPDLPGFGKSAGNSDGVSTMGQFADDLAQLLDELGIDEPITFCGLSMGGYIAWQFWKRHADRLSRLILCDTRAAADTEEMARGRRLAAGRVLDEGLTEFIDAMVPKLFAEETVRDNPAIVEATLQVMRTTAPKSVAAALRGMAEREDMSSELSKIEVPALVICGEHDAISHSDEMRTIAAAMPNANFFEVAGAGHMSPLEQPDRVNAAIIEFLAS
jgi:pimeloyl-ACP methyl ester carboxylesterase